ncbi:dihydroxyacetone kinase-like protein [Streptomyces sp. V4I23]|uniref:dihydroxyacetone kinase subunit DhaL n=1 Tax=Streptomyces sp. V4I23 TaxID=3042282 RepID=UPI002787E055|nr:dihydroxyacetone kinase subunit DhaL [Streptomyces sp. V4I23]MDQ1006878.1 dihydroxyacetone kinase-like protein [Streptomyces sp. V4I23]
MDIDLARAWVQAITVAVGRHKDHLTQLDSAIGDADHGTNLDRGFTAAAAAVSDLSPETVGAVLIKTGTTLVSTIGGASGPLYGGAFRALGKALDTPVADPLAFAGALAAGLESIQKLGTAVPGDKTMIDAYAPAAAAFEEQARQGTGFAAAAAAAADAAEEGMRATTPLQARKGRASYLGARSVGHQDPGATSTALIFRALADTTADA